MDLNSSRDEIRRIDEQMAELFLKRMEAVREIAAYKRERGLPIEDKEQEARVERELLPMVEDEMARSFYIRFLRDTIDVSKQYQHRLMEGQRVAYSGVEGAFAHIAAERIFPDSTAIGFHSFAEAYDAVVRGDCDIALLPMENSYAGEVGQVLDLMYSGDLHVNGVYPLSVAQNLLGVPGAGKEDIRTVISHPHALAQCQAYLDRNGFAVRSRTNTATAAQEVARLQDKSVAAIGSEESARLYGLSVIDHDIQEGMLNVTRFAAFSRVENLSQQKRDGSAFLLLFTVRDEVGGLAKAINLISAYNYNMRILRSRPMHDLPWNYYFYAEVEGDDRTDNGKQMLLSLRTACPVVKVAGRYVLQG